MKKFYIRLLVILILVLAYLVTYEYLYRTIPNTYTYKYDYLSDKNKANKIDVLVLGTSHAYKGINPNAIKYKSFLGACDSQPVYYDAKLLHHFLVDDYTLVNLKYVILGYDYVTLRTGQTINALRESNYSIYWHIKSMHHLPWYKTLKCLKPNLNIARYLVLNDCLIKCDSLGWNFHCTDTVNLDKISDNAIEAAKRHHYKDNGKNIYDRNKELINNIANDCKLHDVKLILLNTPKTKDYCSRLDSLQLNEVTNFADSLQKSTTNVLYVNWQKNSDFDYKDFNDADHLNSAGASKLGRKISSLLDKIDVILQ